MTCRRRFTPSLIAMLGLIAGFYPASSYAQRGPGVAVNAPAEVPQATKPADARPTLVARIEGVLSTKNAKAGDHLTAKTLKSWKLADGTDIPKGSKLVADVTFAQSKAAGNGNSLLAFRFDKAEVKGGGSVPIHGLVVAIGPDLGPKESIGANSVMGRGGVGSTAGLDPSIGVGKPPGARDEFDIPLGSTLPEVKVGRPLNADWTTALRGTKEDIWLDSDVLIKVDFK